MLCYCKVLFSSIFNSTINHSTTIMVLKYHFLQFKVPKRRRINPWSDRYLKWKKIKFPFIWLEKILSVELVLIECFTGQKSIVIEWFTGQYYLAMSVYLPYRLESHWPPPFRVNFPPIFVFVLCSCGVINTSERTSIFDVSKFY